MTIAVHNCEAFIGTGDSPIVMRIDAKVLALWKCISLGVEINLVEGEVVIICLDLIMMLRKFFVVATECHFKILAFH